MEWKGNPENTLWQRRQETFGNAVRLYRCCFAEDNGTVPQMRHARLYANRWQQMRSENMGLLFWGKPGSGKTFAAACIANALLESGDLFPPQIRMATFGTILTELLARSPQEKERYLEELCGCDLLILDDFGMERQTEYAQEQVFNIIDGRYQRGNPMIVTTNLNLQELKSPQDLPRHRICDRLLELCVPVCFDGESQRQGRARKNIQRYKALLLEGNG